MVKAVSERSLNQKQRGPPTNCRTRNHQSQNEGSKYSAPSEFEGRTPDPQQKGVEFKSGQDTNLDLEDMATERRGFGKWVLLLPGYSASSRCDPLSAHGVPHSPALQRFLVARLERKACKRTQSHRS